MGSPPAIGNRTAGRLSTAAGCSLAGMDERLTELTKIGRWVRQEFEQAERLFDKSLTHMLRCGQALIEARRLCVHGEWLPWLEEHFPASRRTAERYMSIARNAPDVSHLPTLSAALEELSIKSEAAGVKAQNAAVRGRGGRRRGAAHQAAPTGARPRPSSARPAPMRPG